MVPNVAPARVSQSRPHQQASEEQFMEGILNGYRAFTDRMAPGAGKSTSARRKACFMIRRGKVAIFVIPQAIIAESFDPIIFEDTGEALYPRVEIGEGRNHLSNAVEFLEEAHDPNSGMSDEYKAIVISPQTFSSLYFRFRKLLSNTFVVYDEAHHHAITPKDTYDGRPTQAFFELIQYDPTCVGLRMTGTDYRADSEYRTTTPWWDDHALTYTYYLSEYFRDNKTVKGVEIDILDYGDPNQTMLTMMANNPARKKLYIFPATNSNARWDDDKFSTVDNMVRLIQQHEQADRVEKDGLYFRFYKGGECVHTTLNLVVDARTKIPATVYRNLRRYVPGTPNTRTLFRVDSIFTQERMHEGADWPVCDCVVMLAPRRSPPRVAQIAMRGARDLPNKPMVSKVIVCVPRPVESDDPKARRDAYNVFFNDILSLFAFNQYVRPRYPEMEKQPPLPPIGPAAPKPPRPEPIPFLPPIYKKLFEHNPDGMTKVDLDIRKAAEVLKHTTPTVDELIPKLEDIAQQSIKAVAPKATPDEIAGAGAEIVQKLVDNWKAASERIVRTVPTGMPLRDLVDDHKTLVNADFRLFCSLDMTADLLAEAEAWLREAASNKTVAEWVIIANDLAAEHGGILPNSKWLQHNGYHALQQCMRTYPDAFAHLEQKRLVKTVDEWVVAAEQLAQEHGGLPNTNWLTKHGHHALYAVMNSNPDAFAHIPKKDTYTSVDEWVRVAERLVAEHGFIPERQWLLKQRYSGLERAMNTKPEAFAQFPRQPRRTLGTVQHTDGRVVTLREGDMTQFCKANGLLPSSMTLLMQGKQKEHRGWTLVQ